MTAFSAVALAGGESKRFGKDKALAEVPIALPPGQVGFRETFLARSIRILREAGASEVLVAAGPGYLSSRGKMIKTI